MIKPNQIKSVFDPIDLFNNQRIAEFEHRRQNTPANQAIYDAQKPRLNLNARIILRCLCEGYGKECFDESRQTTTEVNDYGEVQVTGYIYETYDDFKNAK